MKSSYRDHLKAKFKPTFFGIFEKQDAALLSNVYAYVYNKEVKHSAFMSTCHGPVSGYKSHVTLDAVKNEFTQYNPEVQTAVLSRVNQYVSDFEAATVFHPTQEAYQRLLEVRDTFKAHMDKSPTPQ
ncbi:hypothetical protein [Legionella sp. 16cNR16C]|uniref:hypothetical protein n=1 Tax=Legionella sp. 16cNR16C TaxID=2905656 RepID=UPI001E36C66A|nr:hypothetical protein [Legionella sp. 16cNR16C]MCE3044215.1 hypothetical protein [Legionella sp. 16cNR16C]